MATVTPFLMFEGRAEEAINFYVSLIPNSKIIDIARFGPEGPGKEGTVNKAKFTLGTQTVLAIDSFIKHEFTFTPATSLFVECTTEAELRRIFLALAEGGKVLMPVENYGFSSLFGWTNDQFGVSWQLNLI